jgi:hypothetical protein
MIEFTIDQVVPQYAEDNALSSIAFRVRATDAASALADDMAWATPCPTPAREVQYTAAELVAMCCEIAEGVGVYAELTRRIEARKSGSQDAQPTPTPTPTQFDALLRVQWFDHVDDYIGGVVLKYTRFEMGYVEREAAARAYITSGYSIDPTTWITRFADNTGMAYPDAARLVVSQAETLRAAVKLLDDLRMDKYLIARAPTMDAAKAVYERILADATAIAGRL